MAGPNLLVVSASEGPTQIGPGDPSGKKIGISPTDPLGFFGVAPVAQPNGGGFLVGAVGTVTVYGANQTPSAVAANTSAEQSQTVTGVATGQLVIVSKPTSQAGLLVGTARVSATNTVQLTYGNDTSGSITPTAAELYEYIAIPATLTQSVTLSPVAVAANTTAEQQFALPSLVAGSVVAVNKPTAQAGLVIVGSRTVSPGIMGITFANLTASPITPTAAEAYLVYAGKGLALAPVMTNFTQTLAPVSVAANTTAEQTFTVAGLLSGAPVFVSKPSWQAGLGIAGVRVSAANTLAINFVNDTAAAIVPATEAYVISAFFTAPANSASTAYAATAGTGDHGALVSLGLVAAP